MRNTFDRQRSERGVSVTGTDNRVPVSAADDPIAQPLRLARRNCVSIALMAPALFVVLVVIGKPFGPPRDANALWLAACAVVGLAAAITGISRHVRRGERASDPRTYRVDSLVDFALGEVPLLLGYVAAIVYESQWPFLIGLVPACLVWFWVFPRESVWRNWQATSMDRPAGR
jgi:hypothetical protein